MSGRLQGKTCVVTAAGQGMGRASVEAFQREGASVHASDVDEAKLAGLAKLKGVSVKRLDVTRASVKNLVATYQTAIKTAEVKP